MKRPSFQRIMDDVNPAESTALLQRFIPFWQEHVMMDYYLEYYFPEKKVRYIAVSDGGGHRKGELSDFVPFKTCSMNGLQKTQAAR